MPNPNSFIAIEGNDASGKASVAKLVGEALPAEMQVNVTISGAPNAGALSDAIVDACREIAERGA
jgi:thymidylate kinase